MFCSLYSAALSGMVVVCCLVWISPGMLIGAFNGVSRQNVFLGIGNWHLGTGMGYQGIRGFTEGRIARCSTRIFLVPWKWDQKLRRVCNRFLLQSWWWDWEVFSEELREIWRSTVRLSSSPVIVVCGSPGNTCWCWGLGIAMNEEWETEVMKGR